MRAEKKEIFDESHIKAKCIDFLLFKHRDQLDDYVLVNELQFADGKRRADLVEVNGCMNVFEIKSDLDSLDRLPEQIQDYKNCFDTITIVTTDKHFSNVKRTIPKSIGIVLVRGNEIAQIRKAQTYHNFNRYALAAFMQNDDLNILIKQLKIPKYSKMTITQKRLSVCKILPLDELRGFAIAAIKKNYQKQFECFLRNRGDITLSDDIPLFWNGSIAA